MIKTTDFFTHLTTLVVFLLFVSLPCEVPAAKGGKGGGSSKGGLSLSKVLSFETGELAGIAEPGELLTYRIKISNKSKKTRTTSITETVPVSTTYVGNDHFSNSCTVGDIAGTTCQISNVSVPGKGSITVNFSVLVDNPVTTSFINNSVNAAGVDCQTNDCNEVLPTDEGTPTGFQSVSPSQWTETSIRKVLHIFAYGGLTSDAQISAWASMDPQNAIIEMLTFSYANEKLSPAEDATSEHGFSLEELQNFWSSDDDTNPVLWYRHNSYSTLNPSNLLSIPNQQRTWVQAVTIRGINPFLHRIAFYLTNYQMAVVTGRAKVGPFRSYYDQILSNLVNGRSFTDIISEAAKSAAVAKRYDHRNNMYTNAVQKFSGNDDFAREYFQLFFRLQGETEDSEYHENVTIENNALLLTGMGIDKNVGAYGASHNDNWWVAPIDFTDHTDQTGTIIYNTTNHHSGCLEILHTQICGATAAEKIDTLSPIVASHREVLENLPVYIIKTLADDRLTTTKKVIIRQAWLEANDDLLSFLRAYAISSTFHDEGTVKFRSTFTRNLTLHNAVVLDNEEAFKGRGAADLPLETMAEEGGKVFLPAHNVFGGQTGPEASANASIFRHAYEVSSQSFGSGLSLLQSTYYPQQDIEATWEKDWSAVVPENGNGKYIARDVADWLWQRLIADGGKNFDVIARSQVLALLARGLDFGYLVTTIDPPISNDPDIFYTSSELTGNNALVSIMNTLSSEEVALNSTNQDIKLEANKRVNYAIGFISTLPYTFAVEGK